MIKAARPRFFWRKLSAAKWEDVWWERLAAVRDRVAITALPGRKTIRVEAFDLSCRTAEELQRTFGGRIDRQKAHGAFTGSAARPPIRVRDKLLVVASRADDLERTARDRTRKVLYIPAGMAFGTGDHATTATCLRLLADISDAWSERRWEMLDLGTGTGILAIAARMLGARRAQAYDCDPTCVRIAKLNVDLNAIDRVAVQTRDLRTWRPSREWDVITANLFSRLLVEHAAKIAAAAPVGGRLIFSGLFRQDEQSVVRAFRSAGFHIDALTRRGKWVTGLATLRRRMPAARRDRFSLRKNPLTASSGRR